MAAAVGALRGRRTGCPALASPGNGRRGPAVAAILLPLALLAAPTAILAEGPWACEDAGPAWHIRSPFMKISIDQKRQLPASLEHTMGVCHIVVEPDGSVGQRNHSPDLSEVSWCQQHRARRHETVTDAEESPNFWTVAGRMETWVNQLGDCRFELTLQPAREGLREYTVTGHIAWPGGTLEGESTLPGTEFPIWFFSGVRHGAWRH